jgi:hypothetical protein
MLERFNSTTTILLRCAPSSFPEGAQRCCTEPAVVQIGSRRRCFVALDVSVRVSPIRRHRCRAAFAGARPAVCVPMMGRFASDRHRRGVPVSYAWKQPLRRVAQEQHRGETDQQRCQAEPTPQLFNESNPICGPLGPPPATIPVGTAGRGTRVLVCGAARPRGSTGSGWLGFLVRATGQRVSGNEGQNRGRNPFSLQHLDSP